MISTFWGIVVALKQTSRELKIQNAPIFSYLSVKNTKKGLLLKERVEFRLKKVVNESSLCYKLWFSNLSNYEFCYIKYSKFKISKVFTIMLQRYSD